MREAGAAGAVGVEGGLAAGDGREARRRQRGGQRPAPPVQPPGPVRREAKVAVLAPTAVSREAQARPRRTGRAAPRWIITCGLPLRRDTAAAPRSVRPPVPPGPRGRGGRRACGRRGDDSSVPSRRGRLMGGGRERAQGPPGPPLGSAGGARGRRGRCGGRPALGANFLSPFSEGTGLRAPGRA